MEYGTSGLGSWIRENVITILLLLIAAAVLFAGLRGQISKGITVLAGTLLGLFVLGFAIVPGMAEGVSKFLIGLVGGGGGGE